MRADRSSRTAAQVALSRAIEARRPEAERICFDPMAEQFLDARYRPFLVGPLRGAAVAVIERLFAGHHHYVLVRTRYIDDFLTGSVEGAQQLVILGAGFDSRAYRLVHRLRGITCYEVDHPATSQKKRALIERTAGACHAGVVHVPVDFGRDQLDEALERSGYRADRRTIFLWEGVTPYLTAEAVDDTLRFVANRSAPGSRLLFDYVLDTVVAGTCELRGAREEHAKMRRTPEPFRFGLAPAAIADFLERRGFRDVVDAGAEELGRYLVGDRRDAYVKPWWRIVHAVVA
jgi:methyltransferase (TIGR00027 family)